MKILCKMSTLNKHKDMKLCWIPSHIRVKGKNEADLASRSALDVNMDTWTKIPYTDFKEVINKYIQKERQ